MLGWGGTKSTSNTRFLYVEVISASGIMGVNSKGKSSDSYIRFHLITQAGLKKEENFTTVKKGTLSPVWNEKFTLGDKYSVESASDLKLSFSLANKSLFSLSETPMGSFEVDLSSVEAAGDSLESQYVLQDQSGRNKGVTGMVRLKMWFNRPSIDAHNSVLPDGVHPDQLQGDEKDDYLMKALGFKADTPDMALNPPNELQLVIVQARGLLAMDTAIFASHNTSDPYVIASLVGSKEADKVKKMTTSVKNKCLEPIWNERFVCSIQSPEASLKIEVYDKNVARDSFLGEILLSLSDFRDKKPSKNWYTLLNQGNKNDGVKRGEIEIALRWGVNVDTFQKDILKKANGPTTTGRIGSLLGLSAGYESAPEDEGDVEIEEFAYGGEAKIEETTESAEDKKKREDEEKEKARLLDEIVIKSGDWVIQVHCIEARDLKAENYDGTSDPIVYVECFGQRQCTQVIYKQTSCVFDELLIFNMKNLDKEQFSEGLIRVSVMDYNTVKNAMIGACVFDAATIYQSNKDHELYRQWNGLMDDVDPDDVGVQGYLKLSISIIGPGEKAKVHDVDAELEAEIQREAEAGEDLSSLLLPVPSMRKEWQYVVARVYKCEGLPIMDGKTIGFNKAGTDAFASLTFGGAKPIKTKVKTIKSETRRAIAPIFDYELWYPVSVPTMTSIAKVNVYDHDDAGSELIGQALQKYNVIKKSPGQSIPPKWYNMYGSHEFKDDSFGNNLKKVAGSVKKLAKRLGGVEINWYKFYNSVPDRGCAYRGRTLISWSVTSERPLKYQTPEIVPFRRKISPLPMSSLPPTQDYVLQALIVAGTELPSFTSISSLGASQQLRVRVVIGIEELCTEPAKYEKGMCRWNAFLKSPVLKLPADLSQIPDIFIYLVTEADRPVCFTRMQPTVTIKNADVDSDGRPRDRVELKGFLESTKWTLLEEDKAIDALDAGEFPGSLLMKVGFGLESESKRLDAEWQTCLREAKTATQYQARVHIFQGRNLPSSDPNGLSDPFVCVNFMGHRRCTKIMKKTLYPTWYETVIIDNVSLPESNNFEYASQVNMRVYDNDLPLLPGQSRPTLSDEYIGMTQYSLNNALVCDLDVPCSDFPDPFWKPLFFEKPGDSQGDLLVLVQLIKTNGRNLPDKIPSPIPRELSIIPASRDAFLELIILGCRDLAPFNFRPMVAPFLDMSLDSLGTSYRSKTNCSKIPDPSNPNFLERIVLPVRLPLKSIYASPLSIKVRDSRLGGYLKPVVGIGAIQLATKIPWCPDTYIAPGTDVYIAQAGNDSAKVSKVLDLDAQKASEKAIEDQLASLEAEAKFHERGSDDDMSDEENADVLESDALLDKGSGLGKSMFDVKDKRVDGVGGLKAGGLDSSKETRRESFSSGVRRKHRKSLSGKVSFSESAKVGGGTDGLDSRKDAVAKSIEELRNQRKLDLLHDDFIVNPEPPAVDAYIKQRATEVDTGAGVFGGLKHITITGGTKEDKESNAFTDPDWTQDDGDLPPDWSIGRKKLDSELESDFVTTPFETYEFVRGKQGKAGKLFGHSFKIVGKLKGLIRVMETENDPPMFPEEIMNMMLKPRPYKVRLYVLRASGLTGMDLDMFGNIAKSDPYIKVELGKFVYNDRKHAIDNVTDCDLYQMIEINAELPGCSQLQISMMDKDTIGADDLIGKTTVDLEDRWFDSRWQQWGEENMILPGNDANDENRIRWKTKPIERRNIHVPSSTAGQGVVEMWVDIMSPEEAQSFPPDQVALPPSAIFEVRLVIWKARDVPPMDVEGMSDLFVKAWPESCAPQETDTHWRAKKGKASWNYRLLFDVELGHNSRAMKFPYLYLQLWDRDIIKWSDCAGEAQFNLGKFYRKAFKRNIALKLFEQKAGMQATRERKQTKIKKPKVEDIGDADMVTEEAGDVAAKTAGGGAGADAGAGPASTDEVVEFADSSKRLPGPDSLFVDTNPMSNSAQSAPMPSIGPASAASTKASTASAKTAATGGGGWFGAAKTDEPADDDDDDEDDEDDSSSLLGRADAAGKTKAQLEEEEDDAEEMKETVDTFKNMTGLWDIDPPDSDWVHIMKKDHNTDKVTPMGSVAISIQIWPKEKSKGMPVGGGRNEPNSNPFLPPPVGRIKWSWNPFVLGAELCGPKLCGYFTCCLLCTAFILLMIFCQPFLNIIINLIFVVF